jgi:hypothetical protein
MAIELGVKGFSGPWAVRNTFATPLAVNVADVVLAAVTVGGPVRGSVWHRSLRRAGVAGSSLAALIGAGRHWPLATSSLYQELETTEKSGLSFRLGMAFAAVAAEHVLDVQLLEHLNRGNAVLTAGSQRRADLFGVDGAGHWHVVEAKSRTYGFAKQDIQYAKQQAVNVHTVRPNGAKLLPATRSASLADLSGVPISVLLVDPTGEPVEPVVYEVDLERLISTHYAAVPDLIEAQGGPQPPPDDLAIADVVGAYLPGTSMWLGVRTELIGDSRESWEQRIRERELVIDSRFADADERVSIGFDGHVLHLGSDLARTYDWGEPFG